MPFESEEYAIDDEMKIISIKYELLPFSEGIESSVNYNRDVVARRRTTVSGGNACLQFSNKATVDMYGTEAYDSELYIDEGSMIYIGDSCNFIARRGDCRIIIKGGISIGNGVTFEAKEGSTLNAGYKWIAEFLSNVTFINCDLVLPYRNVAFINCHFMGTPLVFCSNGESEYADVTASVIRCDFVPNGHNYPRAVFIKDYPYYIVSDCSIDCTADSTFANGIYIKYSGSHNGSKNINGNTLKRVHVLTVSLLMWYSEAIGLLSVCEICYTRFYSPTQISNTRMQVSA